MLDKETLNAIGVLLGGTGAFLGSIAQLIKVLRKEKKQPTNRMRARKRKRY